jgi:putative ABC transport system permease protein
MQTGAQAFAGKASRLPMLVFMAWRNIWRNPSRSALTVAALAGSMVLMVLYIALVGGMTRQMVEHATDLSVGHLQLQRQAFTDDQDLYATLPSAALAQLARVLPDAAMAPRLYASALASAGTGLQRRA